MNKRIPIGDGRFATVDDEDFEILSRFHWFHKKPAAPLLCAPSGGKAVGTVSSGNAQWHLSLLEPRPKRMSDFSMEIGLIIAG